MALKVMGKYLRTTNPNALAESYDIDVQKYLLRVPLTTAEAMKSVLDDLAGRIPKAKDADPKKILRRQLRAANAVQRFHRRPLQIAARAIANVKIQPMARFDPTLSACYIRNYR